MAESDRTASLMSPGKLAQMKPQPAATPAAWLTQMAADAGHLQVRRIGELAQTLRQDAACPELPAIAQRLKKVADDLPGLDFSLLEPRGWWARTSGKSRDSSTEFSARFERLGDAARSVAPGGISLRPEQSSDAALAERTVVELEVEYRAVEKIIDQGARWLQDMRAQLKLRQAAATDLPAQQAVLEDSNRCDVLVARLKLLRALCSAAGQVQGLVKANAARRAALAQILQQSLTADLRDWQGRVSAAAAAAAAGMGSAPALQAPLRAHRQLQSTVAKAVTACEELLAQEQALAQVLAALVDPQAVPG